jgi:hypothetical protein
MRTLREAASDLRETVPTAVPEVCDRLGRGQMQGTIKEAQVSGNATTEVGATGYRGLWRTQRIVSSGDADSDRDGFGVGERR